MRPLFAFWLVACASDPSRPAPAPPPDAAPAPPITYVIAPSEVTDVVAPVRSQYALPSLTVLVFQKGTVIAEGVDGVRKVGDDTPAARSDAFMIGGDIQPMTSTLAAMFVERGVLAWDTKLASLGVPMDASWSEITLEQLIGQRGGAPDTLPTVPRDGDPRTLRAATVQTILSTPATAAGVYHESSASFLLANALLESKTGRAWEDLVANELFAPLGMSTCAYIASDDGTKPSLPWGHIFDEPAQHTTSFEPGADPEPPRALAPARGLRCSLEDWGRFAALHLKGSRAEPTSLLGTPSFAKLQAPIDVTHALGWEAVSRTWAGATLALSFRSREPSSCAVVWILPDKDTAILAATNQGGVAAEKALDDVVLDLVAKLVPPT